MAELRNKDIKAGSGMAWSRCCIFLPNKIKSWDIIDSEPFFSVELCWKIGDISFDFGIYKSSTLKTL